MTLAEVRHYIYLGFQPLTSHELGFKRKLNSAKDDPKRRCIAVNTGDYKCKLGFHVLRIHQEERDLVTYLAKKPLKWTIDGSGSFFFPLPDRYGMYANPSRAGEEDLKSLILNFRFSRICDSNAIEGEPYSSGEFFTLADGIKGFPALQKVAV